MRVQRSYTFRGSTQEVWDVLLDPTALKGCMPGVSELVRLAPDSYQVTLSVGMAALRGTYRGTIAITDKQAPSRYTLTLEGSGGPARVKGVAHIQLHPAGDAGTRVDVEGEGQIEGLLAGIGQKMLGGVFTMLLNDFFECVRAEHGG